MEGITIRGTDGSVMRYLAIVGDGFSPREIGWVLVVEGTPDPIAPQALTVVDVAGDLRSMGIEEDGPGFAALQVLTEAMIKSMQGRADRLTGTASKECSRRAAELERELAAISAGI